MSDIDHLFEQALQLQEPERGEFLASLDATQRESVQKLLDDEVSLADRNKEFLNPDALQTDDLEATFLSNVDRSPPKKSADPEATFLSHNEGSAATPKSTAEPATGDSVRYFGEYELLEEIARGGMGVVFKARQVSLNRIVALKMILSGNLAGEEEISRFQVEAEAAAKLDHWGIVPIYEIGEHEGQHYFSMGLVEGDSLADRIRNGPLEPKQAAEQCRKITEAIAYAHTNGVIHRDLKPANVLLDLQGQPKITDFGLAKQVQGDSNLTATGAVMGTPGYMPPEQAKGDSDNIGTAADVYSLGAILYAMLTGHAPFQAANVMDTLRQVLEQEPVPPRQLNPSIDRDLQTICLKCLEKSAAKRYASADELVEELQRYLNGEPIHARPISWVERAFRWRRRNPAPAALITIVVGLFLTAPMIAARQAQVAQQQRQLKEDAVTARDQAEQQRTEADVARTLAETQRELAEAETARADAARAEVEREQERVEGLLYSARISLAHGEWLDNNPTRTRQLLNECPAKLRNWEWQYLDELTRSEQTILFPHKLPASVQFSPSGNSLLTRGTSDKTIKLWDVSTGLETRAKQMERLTTADFPTDDEHVLALSSDDIAYVHIPTGKVEAFGGFGQQAVDARLIDDGKKIAGAFADGSIVIYERSGGKELQRTPVKLTSDRRLELSPDAKFVAGTDGTTVKVWHVETGDLAFDVTGHAMAIQDTTFSPDSSLFAVADGTGTVTITDVATGNRTQTLRAHDSGVTVVEFSRDGQRLATGSHDHTVRVFDVASGEQLLTIRGHSQHITDVDFHPDGTKLATAAGDGSVRVWDIQHRINKAPRVEDILASEQAIHLGHKGGLEARIFYGHRGPQYDVAISPDGRFVATTGIGYGDDDEHVCVWSLSDSTEFCRFPVAPGWLHTLTFSADSQQLLITSGGAGDAVMPGSVTVWDLDSQQKLQQLDGNPCMFSGSALNNQNDLLAVVFGNLNYGNLRIYSFPACELLYEHEITGERLSTLAFSASGNEVLAASHPGGTVRVWDARSGAETAKWQAHGSGIFRMAISSNDLLAVANIDASIGIWNWKTQTQLAELKGHGTAAVDLDFNPDGTRLLSSAEDATVKIWNLQTFNELLTFREHRMPAMGNDWSSDGRQVASVSRDGALIIRELPRNVMAAEVEWFTLFEDDFERREIGDDWQIERMEVSELENTNEGDWNIQNGRLQGTLAATKVGGTIFPAAYIALKTATLPRDVDITVDVTMLQPMLAQVVLRNSRSEQFINPFIATTTTPFGFKGSSVLMMKGVTEAQILGSQTAAVMTPGQSYRWRILRQKEELKFWQDGRLLEHVRIPTIEAEVLQLGGSWSTVGDQIAFDNLVVKAPQSAVQDLQIRSQVDDWLTQLLLPDLVKENIAAHYPEKAERERANALLTSLTAANSGGSNELVTAFANTAARPDATPEDYEIAARQAQFYIEHQPDEWWHWSKVGLAFLRAGRVDDALERLDLAVEKCLEVDGHVLPLVLVGRTLALHEQGKQAEAEAEHRKLLDVLHTGWQSQGLDDYQAELAEKVPVEVDALQEELVQKVITSDKAYWYGRNMQKWAADKADDLVGVQGRNREPDQYDRTFNRKQYMKLSGIFSTFNPPPAIHAIWDQIQFDHEAGSDKARLEWVAIQKFQNMKFRFGQWFDFEKRDDKWLIVQERAWHMDMWMNGEWTVYDAKHWAKLDAELADMPEVDPDRPAALVRALRFEEAHNVAEVVKTFGDAETASKVLTTSATRAKNLVVLGEAAINTSRFEEGIRILEDARVLDPTVRMPWFLTRLNRSFTSHKSVVFGLDFHPTENLLATCHQDKAIVLWNPDTAKIERTFADVHAAHAVDVKFSHDGSKLVSIGWDNVINVTSMETGKRLQQFSGHLERLYRLERHPTKELYITSSADNTAKVWDIVNERELFTLVGHDNDVMDATFSPDGTQIASGSVDETIRLWDAATGQQTAKMEAHEGGTWRVDYAPDGKTLVSCGRDGKVKIWDVATQEELAVLEGHEDAIEVVRVSPDGKLAASADIRGNIFVWDLAERKAVCVLREQQSSIYNLQFHGGDLYTVGADRTARQWDIDFEVSPLQRSLDRIP